MSEIAKRKRPRKAFTASERKDIVRETLKPKIKIADVASKYGVHPNVLYKWRQDERNQMAGERAFVEVNKQDSRPSSNVVVVVGNLRIEFPPQQCTKQMAELLIYLQRSHEYAVI